MFCDLEPLVRPEQNHSCSGSGPNTSTVHTFPSLQSDATLCKEGQDRGGTSRRETDDISEMVSGLVSWTVEVDTIKSIISPVS